MISSWRKKRAGRCRALRGGGPRPKPNPESSELVTPTHFRCPISLSLMKDPVTLSTGITYDRKSIETWIDGGNKICPVTKQYFKTLDPVPNHTLRLMIQDWGIENRAYGVERIPTPGVPVSSIEAAQILGRISASQSGPKECLELVAKVINAVKESERNTKCFVSNGAARSLALAFESYADVEGELAVLLLEEVTSALILTFPLDTVALSHLSSSRSLARLMWVLRCGGLSARRSAVLILKELISSSTNNEKMVDDVAAIEGGMEGLVELIRDPLCPASTKASLSVIYNMMITFDDHRIGSRFVELGLVPLILHMLVDSDKSTSEKGLGVLDRLCRIPIGFEATLNYSLLIPVVVKKILRVSDVATEFSVSVLWRLSQGEGGHQERVLVEALQVGAFQKLLLILQLGWSLNDRIKEKVTKLLKLLNVYRDRVECIDSMDFKNLKRPF